MTDLSIIIVSWNVSDFLAACLDSIQANTAALDYEVIVVDSASSDDSVAMIRNRFAWVKLLTQTENVGFTKGNNIGLKAAQGRHVMLLNPDTEIIGDALVQMVRYLDAHADVGIVGPRTLNTDGSPQSTRRRFPSILTAMFDSTWLAPFAPRHILDHYYARDVEETATADVDWVQGSALMTRRAIYEQVGGLDERYVMFSEELDWCKRIRSAGWRAVYLGTAQIVHHGGKSTEQVHALKHIYFQQSKIRYFGKFHGALAALWVRLFLIGNYAEQTIVEAVKALLGSKREMRNDRVRMYWQVIRALVRP
jgi:GT2 family glycosyltransferase